MNKPQLLGAESAIFPIFLAYKSPHLQRAILLSFDITERTTIPFAENVFILCY